MTKQNRTSDLQTKFEENKTKQQAIDWDAWERVYKQGRAGKERSSKIKRNQIQFRIVNCVVNKTRN